MSRESVQLGQCGEVGCTVCEHYYGQISVTEWLQPNLEGSHQSLHFIYVFYMLPPKIKISMCQTGDV